MTAASGPSRLLVVGASHRSSSAALRERLFVDDAHMPSVLGRLREAGLAQAMVLSTCDRVEVEGVHDDPEFASTMVIEVLAGHSGADRTEIDSHCYRFEGRDAVRHLFTVAASLDSLVVGEPQILGQVKESHRRASESAMVGPELGALLAAAYRAAKRVRTETSIGERPVSIAAAAERLARNVHGDLGRCAALLAGPGDMGELVAEHLRRAGLGRVVVATRIASQADDPARRLGGHVADFDDLPRCIAEADIVISATGGGRYVIDAAMAGAALKARRRKPIFVIDAAVPGDVHPAVNALDDVFVYDLADLETVALEGRAGRDAEAGAAAAIVEEEVARYFDEQAGREANPAVAALRAHFEAMRQEILDGGPNDPAAATRLLINRLLHEPSDALRRMAVEDGAAVAEAERLIARLFGVSMRRSPEKPRRPDEETDR
jgi:glutamyl-tRNA reductase